MLPLASSFYLACITPDDKSAPTSGSNIFLDYYLQVHVTTVQKQKRLVLPWVWWDHQQLGEFLSHVMPSTRILLVATPTVDSRWAILNLRCLVHGPLSFKQRDRQMSLWWFPALAMKLPILQLKASPYPSNSASAVDCTTNLWRLDSHMHWTSTVLH